MLKTLKKYMMAIMAVMIAAGFSAYRTVESADSDGLLKSTSALQTVCFEYTGVDEPGDEALQNINYIDSPNPPSCPLLRETLCGICFDTGDFPLDGTNPDFENEDLVRLINQYKANPTVHGSEITDPLTGKKITLYFRAMQ